MGLTTVQRDCAACDVNVAPSELVHYADMWLGFANFPSQKFIVPPFSLFFPSPRSVPEVSIPSGVSPSRIAIFMTFRVQEMCREIDQNIVRSFCKNNMCILPVPVEPTTEH